MEVRVKMENPKELFISYMAGYEGRPASLDEDVLRNLAEQYPWFMTSCILSGEKSINQPLVDLYLSLHPCPVSLLEKSVSTMLPMELSASEQLIERFLQEGEHRIVPREDAPEFDAAQESSKLDISEDIVTEELADIYLKQGMSEEAKEIYRKLSLLYPEKSIYFAEIIDGIDRRNEQV